MLILDHDTLAWANFIIVFIAVETAVANRMVILMVYDTILLTCRQIYIFVAHTVFAD